MADTLRMLREYIMKMAIYIAFVAFLLNGCVTNQQKNTFAESTVNPPKALVIERTTELGFGFRLLVVAESVNVSFESIGHFEYLYYRDQRLCSSGTTSVSPSGNYAIYEDGHSGILFLFRTSDRKITQLTPNYIAYVDSFKWHEEARTVDAHFATRRKVKTFPLE